MSAINCVDCKHVRWRIYTDGKDGPFEGDLGDCMHPTTQLLKALPLVVWMDPPFVTMADKQAQHGRGKLRGTACPCFESQQAA